MPDPFDPRDRPAWLAEEQPAKREWSPARDRLEAAMELKSKLEEQRRRRRQNLFRIAVRAIAFPFMWAESQVEAAVQLGRSIPLPALPEGRRPSLPPPARTKPPLQPQVAVMPPPTPPASPPVQPPAPPPAPVHVDPPAPPPAIVAPPPAPPRPAPVPSAPVAVPAPLPPPAPAPPRPQETPAIRPRPEAAPASPAAPVPAPAATPPPVAPKTPEPAGAPWFEAVGEKSRSFASMVAERAAEIRRRRDEDRRQQRADILMAVRSMSWDGYLAMVADVFRRDGYLVMNPDPAQASVIDMDVTKGSERLLVSCRVRGAGAQVSEDHLQHVVAAVQQAGATGAFFLTDGRFTPGAREYARQVGLVMVDGDTLTDLVIELTMAEEKDKKLSTRIAKKIGF